ncbi:hypothetical protein ANN_06884 [Periplaneta americana]|uniref:Uncharacterized protein n=1 Tax=Periplaneta americana TaxID=6978 RepID=A0ABQ8TGU7_PERAM|nr:hypothetical protein ANN_06884 [Periplaneta americana]
MIDQFHSFGTSSKARWNRELGVQYRFGISSSLVGKHIELLMSRQFRIDSEPCWNKPIETNSTGRSYNQLERTSDRILGCRAITSDVLRSGQSTRRTYMKLSFFEYTTGVTIVGNLRCLLEKKSVFSFTKLKSSGKFSCEKSYDFIRTNVNVKMNVEQYQTIQSVLVNRRSESLDPLPVQRPVLHVTFLLRNGKYGIPPKIINIIKDMYQGSKAQIIHEVVMEAIKAEPESDTLAVQTSDDAAIVEKKALSEEWNCLDQCVNGIKEECVDHSHDPISEVICEEAPMPITFPVMKYEPKDILENKYQDEDQHYI